MEPTTGSQQPLSQPLGVVVVVVCLPQASVLSGVEDGGQGKLFVFTELKLSGNEHPSSVASAEVKLQRASVQLSDLPKITK